MNEGRSHRRGRLHRLPPLRSPARRGHRGRRRRRPVAWGRSRTSRRACRTRASGSSRWTARHRRELRAAFAGCDAIVHLAAQKIPRYGGALMTLEANVAGVNVGGRGRAGASDADARHRVHLATSTATRRRRSREDGPLMLGPPTTRRWAYAVSKLYDEHVLLALAEEHGLQRHDPALLRLLRPAQPPELVGRPAVRVHRAPARRRAHRHPRRRPADRAPSPTSATPSTASSARWARPRPRRDHQHRRHEPTTILELAEAVQAALGIAPPLRARFVPYEDAAGQLPGRPATAIPTRARPASCSASRPPSPSRTACA